MNDFFPLQGDDAHQLETGNIFQFQPVSNSVELFLVVS